MYKIGVIGKRESVSCFMPSGFDVCTVNSVSEAAEALEEMAESGYMIIFITDDLAPSLAEQTKRYGKSGDVAVVTIPSILGNTGHGMSVLAYACERAVGTNILK